MTFKRLLLRLRAACTSDCRNGQIWNPGWGPIPCPNCAGNSGGKSRA